MNVSMAIVVYLIAIYYAYASIIEKRMKWLAVSLIVFSLIISISFYADGYNNGMGLPKEIKDNKTFNDVFPRNQVYFILNEPEFYPDGKIDVLLAKTDNDFGYGTGEIIGFSYNAYETKFYRISNAYINTSLHIKNFIKYKDGKLERYFPLIEP